MLAVIDEAMFFTHPERRPAVKFRISCSIAVTGVVDRLDYSSDDLVVVLPFAVGISPAFGHELPIFFLKQVAVPSEAGHSGDHNHVHD